MRRRLIEHHTARSQRLAWLALALTTVVLLAPGCVLQIVLSFAEPVIEALRRWQTGWWPWPVSDSAMGGLAIDKIVHALLFAVCGILVSRAWESTLNITSMVLLLFVFGILTELAQHIIPGRSMSLGDVVADTLGAVAGIGIWQWTGSTHRNPGRRMT